MKVTIYSLTSDDERGLQTELFTSERKRDAAAWQLLAERADLPAPAIRRRFNGDLAEAYEARIGWEWHDTMNWNDHVINLPAPRKPARTRTKGTAELRASA